MSSRNIDIVLFGATGDLVSRKVIPALFDLESQGEFDESTKIIAFTRRDLTNDSFFAEFASPALAKKFDKLDTDALERFQKRFSYVRGDYSEDDGFERLKDELALGSGDRNTVLYMAVYPEFYAPIIEHLKRVGIVSKKAGAKKSGWTRVMLEKPFGNDLVSAEGVVEALEESFSEDDVYMIDHYLGKPMLQNIVTVRRENPLFRDLVGSHDLEKIEVRLFEAMGVEERGEFYDHVGAFVDVGQNHALQMLAAAIMDLTEDRDVSAERKARESVFERLENPALDGVEYSAVRAQYEGYRDIEDVDPESDTETYFSVTTFLKNSPISSVPIVLEGGKRVGDTNVKEVRITYRKPKDSLGGPGLPSITFRLEPKEEIEIGLVQRDKTTEDRAEGTQAEIPFRSRDEMVQYTEEYTFLLKEVIDGDRRHFVTMKESLLMWRFVEPIKEMWKKDLSPLQRYEKNALPSFKPAR